MTSKLYVQKRGPSGGSNIDLTAFTGRKGTPFFDENNASLIQLGHRYSEAQASQGTFRLMDPDAELPRSDFNYNLPAHALLTWTEDAPGAEVWLSRGRIASSDGGRGLVAVDDEVDFDCTVDDCNCDLRGQAFTEAWVRPAETDVARLQALQAYTLNGSSSTATHHRDTCVITVSASHLAPNTNTVSMPAKKYLPGTQPADVVHDCADTAGKLYGVVIHHTGGSHLCLLYIVNNDHSTYLSPIKISDHLDEWDPAHPSAPVFEPHWEAGKASLYDGQTLLSGMVGVWQAEAGIFVEYAGNDESYDYWVDPYHDAVSTTSTQAADRTAGILEERRLTHVTHRVSIIMEADQVDMVAAGMSLDVKVAAMLGGQYLDTWQTRRVAECQFEPRLDGRYWAHLQLDRPTLRVAPGRGSASSPLPPQPPVSEVPPTAATDYIWDTFASPDGFDDTTGTIGSGPKYGGGYVYAGALDPSCSSLGFTLAAGTYHVTAIIRSSSSTGSPKLIRVQEVGVTVGSSSSVGNAAETVTFDFTTSGGALEWETTGPETGRKSEVYYVAVTHGSVDSGIAGTPPPAASTDQIGSTGSSNIYSPIDHTHAAQSADVTVIGDEDGYFAGESVEDALQELGEAKVPAGGADGEVLTKQSGADWDVDWEAAGSGGTLDDLTDVVITAPADGDLLEYDSGSGDWVNVAAAGGGTLNALSDVVISSPADGEVLTYDSGSGDWVNAAGGGGAAVPTLLQSTKGSADTPDDEFPTSSLDAQWTVTDGSSGTASLLAGSGAGVYDLATRPGWLLLQIGTAAGDGVELRQDYTLPDGKCLVTYMSFPQDFAATPTNNEIWAGMGVNDNDSIFAGTTGQTGYVIFDTEASNTASYRIIGLHSSGGGAFGGVPSGHASQQGVFLRVDRVSLDYHFFFSTDGFGWSYVGVKTMSTAANNVWLFARCEATMANRMVIGVPWFRQGTALAVDPWTL